MSTPEELGMDTPTLNDLIRDGAGNITTNAEATAQALTELTGYVNTAVPFRGNLDQVTSITELDDLPAGRYTVRYIATAEAWGLPQRLRGHLIVETGDVEKQIIFRPNDAGSGWGTKSEWVLSTNSAGQLRDRWQRLDKAIMRTAPVVLTAPAGEYAQVNSWASVRLPFTVPTNVGRVRVHMRTWSYRTEQTWGPAILDGLMIAEQSAPGSGTITGPRWYAETAPGKTVGSSGWVSDWFYVGLEEDHTYLLSYGADWQDTERGLLTGACWGNDDIAKWDSTEEAIFANGWGNRTLQPMDVWIECEAPSTVPVWGYYGASNTIGVSTGPTDAVFNSYPQVHARKNKAFCALTAAGGWSLMDDTAHDLNIMRRFGYPARMLDRAYLDWGSNIANREATAAEAITEMERWMTFQMGSGVGNPDVYLVTQVPRDDITDTGDTYGTLSDWNQWIRYVAAGRPEVKGVTDFAAIFADPARPWTAREELRAGPGDVHFSAMGQMYRARALDGEVQLPTSTARNPAERDADPVWETAIPLTADWRTDVGSEVTAHRAGNVVTVSAWRLAPIAGVTGTVTAYTLPSGYRPPPLTGAATADSRGAEVLLTSANTVTVSNPSGSVSNHSFTFVTLDPAPWT